MSSSSSPRWPVALLLVLLVACTRARTKAPSDIADVPAEVSVAGLPAGRLPKMQPEEARSSQPRANDTSLGINVVRTKHEANVLTGVSNVPDFEDPLIDAAEAQTAYCVLLQRADDDALAPFALPALAAEIDMPTTEVGSKATRFYAERFEDGATPKLHAVTAWVDAWGRVQKSDETISPLRRVAEMGGVQLFAFTEPATDDKGSVQLIVRRPLAPRGHIKGATFIAMKSNGVVTGTWCPHVRLALPYERGDGSTVRVDVAVETPNGARPLRINASTLWLQDDPAARLTMRMRWMGPEQESLDPTQLHREPVGEEPGSLRGH